MSHFTDGHEIRHFQWERLWNSFIPIRLLNEHRYNFTIHSQELISAKEERPMLFQYFPSLFLTPTFTDERLVAAAARSCKPSLQCVAGQRSGESF